MAKKSKQTAAVRKTSAEPAPKISKGQAQKAKLLAAATKLLARHGLEGASFQMIADACGISQSAVLYHYPSKSDLLEEVMKAILLNNHSYVEGALSDADDGLERVRKYFRATLEWKSKHLEEAQIVLLLYYSTTIEARFQRFYALIVQNVRTRLTGYLLAAQREHLLKKNIDISLVVELLHEAIIGGIINGFALSNPNAYNDKLLAKWDHLLRSLT